MYEMFPHPPSKGDRLMACGCALAAMAAVCALSFAVVAVVVKYAF